MAEAKNTFLRAKMNKDLDDRILPNGEYRDALNISVGRSEDDDVGSLENVKGNSRIPKTISSNTNLKCIGKFEDEVGNRIFQILTDYTDPVSSCGVITYPSESATPEMKITVYDFDTSSYNTLIQGKFLNFAKNKCWQVTGINLVEDLLFWTDNRNQPRKINVTTALGDPNYYTEEHQISVAKYMPQKAPELYKEVDTTVTTVTDTTNFILETVTGISIGMSLVSNAAQNAGSQSIAGSEYIKVTAIDTSTKTVTLNVAPATAVVVGQRLRFIETTMTNESGNSTWPGDPSYLEDKYVRFSYRLQYDDGEYSLMSPFTQIAFIPQQAGFFLYGDEQAAFESSIIKWFENNVDNVKLRISLPGVGSNTSTGGSTSKNVLTEYKIKNIDILYKESDGLVVKVLKTISGTTMANEMVDNVYVYEYQSEKPYKTLTEGQTTRVYDKVPVRALAQDIAGNRVIYGNFKDKHTPYDTLDYNCTVQEKNDLYTSWAEYPNSTIKQNRTYQIGFVLADKFGRQSSVILSEYDTLAQSQGSTIFGGSTVFHPYYDANDSLDVKAWFGDAALVLLNQTIGNFQVGASDTNLQTGAPGLYGEPAASWVVNNANNDSITYDSTTDEWNLKFSVPTIGTVPSVGMYIRGEYCDYTEILAVATTLASIKITTKDKPNSYYLYLLENTTSDTKFAYYINTLGWYSYKIVVKQREQDYYNAYLPGFLDGYPEKMTQGSEVQYIVDTATNTSYATNANGINEILFPGGELDNTAHSVLINDNINKIPRDLAEVGPDQKQYRSSVELFGRVNNYEGKFNITNFTHTGCTSPPCPGADQVNEIKFAGKNDPSNTAVFCPTGSCTGQELALEPGMALLMATCEYFGGVLQDCSNTVLPQYYQFPERFSNATLITKVEYDATANETTVTFSPGGAINQGANNIIIEYNDNQQYYPTQKPDIASTIGTADDLGFYQYSVDNFNGSASRNLYQLETNPIVARFSTNQKLGVIAADMVPWLTIYETAPVDSLLDIFWESTTGWNYISDINQDVLAGSDAPGAFSPIGFDFKENQNFDGADNLILTGITGASNSPWITDIFYPRNNTGVNLTTTTSTMTVQNGAGTDVSGLFSLEQVPQTDPTEPGGYRVKFINQNHVFLNSARTVESFTFSLSILYNGETTVRTFTGDLSNIAPTFTLPCSDYVTVTSQTETGTVIDFNAVNGTSLTTSNENDLFFTITTNQVADFGNNYFLINNTTGVLTLNQSLGANVPLGVYTLTVQVQDAVSGGSPLTGGATSDFDSKTATCTFTVTVGPEMIPPYYQGYFQGFEGPWTHEARANGCSPCTSCTGHTCDRMGLQATVGGTGAPIAAGTGSNPYFGLTGYYFGPRQNGVSALPLTTAQAPASPDGTPYNAIELVAGSTAPGSLTPVALDSGQMKIEVTLENIYACTSAGSGQVDTMSGQLEYISIFHRAASTTTPNPNSWTEIEDGNYAAPQASTPGNVADINLTVRGRASNTASNNGFVTGYLLLDANKLPGEYFIAVKASSNTGNCCVCDNGGVQGLYQNFVTLYAEDANFTYTAGSQDQGVLKSFAFQVQTIGGSDAGFPTSGSIQPSPTETVYAHAEYGISVRQFFDDATLLTPWEPSVSGVVPGYFSFKGGAKTLGACLTTAQCSSNGYWNIISPGPTTDGNNCPGQGWNNIGEPLNFNRVSIPLFRGKFSTSGQLLNGYSIASNSQYPTDLATTTIRQTFNGSGSNATTPTNVDVAQFPISRMTSWVGNCCNGGSTC